MTVILRGATIADVSDKAIIALSAARNARHVTIDPVRHRIEFRNDVQASSKVIIQTQVMFADAEIVDLVTVPLVENASLRETTSRDFLGFMATCSADRIIWKCPPLEL